MEFSSSSSSVFRSGAPLPRHPPADDPGCGDPSLDALEVGDAAGDGEPALLTEPVFPLRLPQQLPEQRVVEEDHRHKDPPEVAVFLAYVHCEVAFGDVDGLVPLGLFAYRQVAWAVTPRGGGADGACLAGEAAAPGEEPGEGPRRGRRLVQAVVAGAAGSSGSMEDPPGEPDEVFLQPEASELPHNRCDRSDFGADSERKEIRANWERIVAKQSRNPGLLREGPRVGDGHGEAGQGETDFRERGGYLRHSPQPKKRISSHAQIQQASIGLEERENLPAEIRFRSFIRGARLESEETD